MDLVIIWRASFVKRAAIKLTNKKATWSGITNTELHAQQQAVFNYLWLTESIGPTQVKEMHHYLAPNIKIRMSQDHKFTLVVEFKTKYLQLLSFFIAQQLGLEKWTVLLLKRRTEFTEIHQKIQRTIFHCQLQQIFSEKSLWFAAASTDSQKLCSGLWDDRLSTKFFKDVRRNLMISSLCTPQGQYSRHWWISRVARQQNPGQYNQRSSVRKANQWSSNFYNAEKT